MGIDFESMTDLDPLDPSVIGKNCLTQLYVKDLFGCDYGDDPLNPPKTPVLNIRTNVIAHSNVTADYFIGDGRYLTNLPGFTGNTSGSCLNVLWVGDIRGCNGQVEIWADQTAFLNANGVGFGDVYANNFYGNGSNLTNLNFVFTGNSISDCINELWINNINSCTGTLSLSGNVSVSGSVSATTYYGDGSNLTGINAGGQFTGNTINDCIDEFWVNNINACNGTLDINGNINVDGAITATTVSATTYYGDGSNLTGINGGTIIQNITINGSDVLRIPDFETNGNTVGVGSLRTLASLGYTNASAAASYPLTAARWGGIDAATIDYDTVCIQEAFETLRNGTNKIRKLAAGNGFFIISGHEVILPSYKSGGIPNALNNDSQMFVFDGEGCVFRVEGGLDYGFTSLINNQTEALNSCIDNRWRFGNLKMRGTGTGTAIRIAATRSAIIEQIEVNNFATGIQANFLLNALYSNIATANCSEQGMLITQGWWTGAQPSTAGNQPMFVNCRFRTVDVNEIGCKVVGADSSWFQRCTVEGPDGGYGIYIDLSTTSVAKNARIDLLHAETDRGTYTNAIIGIKGADPFTLYGSQLFWQGPPNVVLIESESDTATNRVVLRDCLNTGPWQLRQINTFGGNTSWDMKNVSLPGGPTTAADVINTVAYPNIWAPGSAIPTPNRVRYEPPMA